MCVRREFFGELKPLKVVALTGLLTVTIRLIPTSLFNYDIPPKKQICFTVGGSYKTSLVYIVIINRPGELLVTHVLKT